MLWMRSSRVSWTSPPLVTQPVSAAATGIEKTAASRCRLKWTLPFMFTRKEKGAGRMQRSVCAQSARVFSTRQTVKRAYRSGATRQHDLFSAQHAGNEQHDHRPDDGHDDSRRMEHRAVGRLREQAAEEAADERTDDTEPDRHPEAHDVEPGHQCARDEAGDGADDDHPE